MDVLKELRRIGRAYPAKAPPIPVCLSGMGMIGHVENRRRLYVNSALARHVDMLIRENEIADRVAREISNGRFGASELLPIAQLGTDSRDAIRAIKSMRSAITSWDGVISARANSKFFDYMGTKASPTTVANSWHSMYTAAGMPSAGAFTTIPGPAAKTATDAGAWPIPITLGATEDLYLTNFGVNHGTGTNIVLAVDILTANGNILTSIVTSQNVSSTALTRWTGGAGIMITLEVQTAPGASTGVPGIRVNYTDQSGNTLSDTGVITQGAAVTSPIVGRLLPIQDGPMIRLATGDWGVRSVQQVTISVSSAGAGGNMALLQYKPLLLVPTLAVTSFVERSTPSQIGGIRKLTEVAQGALPFISFFILPSTTGTGIQTMFTEMVYG